MKFEIQDLELFSRKLQKMSSEHPLWAESGSGKVLKKEMRPHQGTKSNHVFSATFVKTV